MFSQFQSKIDTIWCSVVHKEIMWPIHGQYECRTCGRRYAAFGGADSECGGRVAKADGLVA